MSTAKKYLSLVKFSHTIFAMPFALVGFFLGLQVHYQNLSLQSGIDLVAVDLYSSSNSMQYVVLLVLVILCMVFARSAAMAFNRYLDRHFDAKNPRTALREIPAGIISKENALRFVILNSVLFITCTFFINSICFFLSPLALFIILFYSYTKRFTALCHIVLGVGLGLAPIGAYLAISAEFAVLPVLFSFAVLFWVSGFDIIYSLQDEDFDKSQHLHSIPVAVGKKNALGISRIFHFLSAFFIIAAGFYGDFSFWYWLGVILFVSLLIYQHSIVKHNDLSRVNIAFMTTNGAASIVFAIFVLVDIFLHQ